MKLRLLTYNIREGGTGRAALLAAVIRAAAPDVVMLQEATDPAVVRQLATSCGFRYRSSRRGYSTGFLSHIPDTYCEWHRPRGSRHAFLELALAGDAPRIFGLHLRAWFSGWSERQRVRELRALLAGIEEHQHGFHLIAGDFNALAPGAELQSSRMPAWIRGMIWLSGRDVARDTIELATARGYADAWQTLHPGEPGATFPAWDPHLRLDYAFTPARYADRITRCEIQTSAPEARTASDHFPLLVEVADG